MDKKEDKLAQLRSRAETALKQAIAAPHAVPQDIDEVLHELNVHQVELEIQLEDLQQSYRALEMAQKRYANLFDFAPVGYIVTDRQGIVVNANLTMSSMLGVERETLEKRAFAEFITKDFQDIYHLSRRAVLQTRRADSCEAQLQRADGTIFHAHLNTDLPDPLAETLRTAVTNVSIIKQSEEVLSRALAHEKEINELRTRVLSVISHEFRTPLTIILSAAETLEHYGDQLPGEERTKRYQTIRNFVWYLNDTVHDASSISAIDDQPSLKLKTFDVLDFIRQLTHDMGIMAKEGQTIQLETTSLNEIEMVTWDQNLARRIIVNLLNNALIYSKEPVQCRVECQEKGVRLRVEDRGIGISAEDQKYMYEAFFRGKNTNFVHGTGIGLFVVQRAVYAHGGTIHCASRLGEGTSFTVELPRQVSVLPPSAVPIRQPVQPDP
ncbi:MAG: PAS domain-containing sensor histidine kinase [Chloroflexota bacterium]|nr:PAS domain-containing sensor histidine kinase [Chloroflexota bacterium]